MDQFPPLRGQSLANKLNLNAESVSVSVNPSPKISVSASDTNNMCVPETNQVGDLISIMSSLKIVNMKEIIRFLKDFYDTTQRGTKEDRAMALLTFASNFDKYDI